MRESVAADPEFSAARRTPPAGEDVEFSLPRLDVLRLVRTSQARRDVHEECARSYSSCRLAHALRLPGRRRRISA
jgi:hypothetical protein